MNIADKIELRDLQTIIRLTLSLDKNNSQVNKTQYDEAEAVIDTLTLSTARLVKHSMSHSSSGNYANGILRIVKKENALKEQRDNK